MKRIADFPNKPGKHCISTAIRDIFELNGYDFPEEFIFGLDSSLGFELMGHDKPALQPLFLGGKRTTFDGSICRSLGLTLIEGKPSDDEAAWREVQAYLDSGVPVMVQADMYYLDYFRSNAFHFGGHMFVLTGYDEAERIVYVSERQDPLLREKEGPFYRLSMDRLRQARGPIEGDPLSPDRKYYVFRFDRELSRAEIAEAVQKAVRFNAESYLNLSGELSGVSGIAGLRRSLSRRVDELLGGGLPKERAVKEIKKQLLMLAANIETNGTGGGLFRSMYAAFLSFARREYGLSAAYDEASGRFEESGRLWSQIAGRLTKMSGGLSGETAPGDFESFNRDMDRDLGQIRRLEERAFEALLHETK